MNFLVSFDVKKLPSISRSSNVSLCVYFSQSIEAFPSKEFVRKKNWTTGASSRFSSRWFCCFTRQTCRQASKQTGQEWAYLLWDFTSLLKQCWTLSRKRYNIKWRESRSRTQTVYTTTLQPKFRKNRRRPPRIEYERRLSSPIVPGRCYCQRLPLDIQAFWC